MANKKEELSTDLPDLGNNTIDVSFYYKEKYENQSVDLLHM